MSLNNKVVDGVLIDLGDQQIDSLVAVTSLTLPTTGVATVAIIQAQGETIRWRSFEQTPTASAGGQIEAGDSITYTGDLTKFRMIEESSGAKAYVSYYYGG